MTRDQRLAENVADHGIERPQPQGNRRGRLRSRDLVVLLVVALGFYLLLIGARGISLLADHRWTVKGLGLGVLLLPLVGVAIVVAEVRFGRATERLARLLGPDPFPDATSPDPDQAFGRRQIQVEAAPDDWRAWYRLAIAYGDARDIARGRRAMHRAIRMQQAEAAGCGGATA